MANSRIHIERRLADHPAPTPQPTPCRLWQGRVNHWGYGMRPENTRMHRWVVEQIGADQFGTVWDPMLEVLHLCDNPPCYRYSHLMLGDNDLNRQHMMERGRGDWSQSLQGEEHPLARLTEDDVRAIRRAPKRRGGNIALAEQYGVSLNTIEALRSKSGRTWPGVQ